VHLTVKREIHLANDELKILQDIRRGDEKAFRLLYDLYFDRVFRFLAQFSKDRDEIKEWCQRTFVKLHENAATFKGLSSFSSWLFQIAINEMRMDRRREKWWDKNGLEEDAFTENLSFEEDIEWSLTLKTWIGEMKPHQRAVFVLYEVEGYSHSEIAMMLGIRESTSRASLSLSKRFLKNRYMQEGHNQ